MVQASISRMMYADDLILLSKSEEGLQSMLDKLYELCESSELSRNLKKTKCLTFQNKNKVRNTATFYVQNTALESVAEYTYLGITINCHGSFHTALVDLRNKANRAFFSLNSKFQFKKLPIRIRLNLLVPCYFQSFCIALKFGLLSITWTLTNGTHAK